MAPEADQSWVHTLAIHFMALPHFTCAKLHLSSPSTRPQQSVGFLYCNSPARDPWQVGSPFHFARWKEKRIILFPIILNSPYGRKFMAVTPKLFTLAPISPGESLGGMRGGLEEDCVALDQPDNTVNKRGANVWGVKNDDMHCKINYIACVCFYGLLLLSIHIHILLLRGHFILPYVRNFIVCEIGEHATIHFTLLMCCVHCTKLYAWCVLMGKSGWVATVKF